MYVLLCMQVLTEARTGCLSTWPWRDGLLCDVQGGCWDPNAGPHDWAASALAAEPSCPLNRETTFLLFLFSYWGCRQIHWKHFFFNKIQFNMQPTHMWEEKNYSCKKWPGQPAIIMLILFSGWFCKTVKGVVCSLLRSNDSATLSSNLVFCSSEGTVWLWWYFLWAKWFAPYQCTALFDTKDELVVWNLPSPNVIHLPPHNVMYYLRASFNKGFLGSPGIAQNSPTFHALNIFQGEKKREEWE